MVIASSGSTQASKCMLRHFVLQLSIFMLGSDCQHDYGSNAHTDRYFHSLCPTNPIAPTCKFDAAGYDCDAYYISLRGYRFHICQAAYDLIYRQFASSIANAITVDPAASQPILANGYWCCDLGCKRACLGFS